MTEKYSESTSSGLRIAQTTRSAKENYIVISPPANYAPKSPSKFAKSSNIYPSQHNYATTAPHWSTSSGMKIISPNIAASLSPQNNGRRPEIIELGGKRQKRQSLHKDNSIDQSRKVEISNDGLIHKVSMLEGRIRQLHRQKQQTIFEFNQRLKKMQFQNDRLTALVHNYEQERNHLGQFQQNVQNKQENEQFDQLNLSEMLSTQININLQLREQSERLNEQVKRLTQKSNDFESKLTKLQLQKKQLENSHHEQLSKWSKQKQDYQQNQQNLQTRILQLQELRVNRQSAISELIQQKQKRILGLQEELYSQCASNQHKEKQISELSEDLASVKLENTQIKEQLESLKNRNVELQKQQCKKCKDLLHTVFRLNCQLNKK